MKRSLNGLKFCYQCQAEKPFSEYSVYKNGKLKQPCKVCCYERSSAWRKANLARAAQKTREWHKRNPERSREMYRVKSYKDFGYQRGDFDKMLAAQEGGCAICGEKNPTKGRGGLHVDHCDVQKKIRGVLCYNCNIGIGNLQHDPRILQAALEYLLKHNGE